MKTKTALIILGLIAAIAIIVMLVMKPKADNSLLPEPSMNTQQTAPESQTTTEGEQSVIVEPTAPTTPAFPVTGVDPEAN